MVGGLHQAGRRRPQEDQVGLGAAHKGARLLEVAAVRGEVRDGARARDQVAQEEDDRRGVRVVVSEDSVCLSLPFFCNFLPFFPPKTSRL